jgi:hypothetical protein
VRRERERPLKRRKAPQPEPGSARSQELSALALEQLSARARRLGLMKMLTYIETEAVERAGGQPQDDIAAGSADRLFFQFGFGYEGSV